MPRLRVCNVLARTLHLAAFGLLLGGTAYEVDPPRLMPALMATVATGLVLVVLELAQDPRWPFLGKGLFVLAKLVLLLLVPVFPGASLSLLVAVVVIAGIGAHMPSELRHYSVRERRAVRCEERTARPWRTFIPTR